MGPDTSIRAIDWVAIYPELLLLVMTCVITLIDLWVQDSKKRSVYLLTLATLFGLCLVHLTYFVEGIVVYGMSNMVVVDAMGSLLKLFATAATAVTLIYGRQYASDRGVLGGELFALALFSLLGQYVIISGNNLLVIYMGLEAMSLSLYALVALRRDDATATEAAMKYFVLGALASGFLLYGMSMLYGATGSLELNVVFQGLASTQIHRDVVVLGIVFLVAGIAFKLSAVPFHMWAPDVYQGAPTITTLLIGGAPKLAAFAMCIRLLVEGALPMAVDWQKMLGVLAVGSLLIGNLAAIAQSDIKRMLAYSAIAQMGFMMLGLMSGVVAGNTLAAANAYSSAMFYVVSYVLTTVGTFGALMLLSRQGYEVADLSSLKGLNRRSPLIAAVLALFMFSLAGIPPLVGFYAKLSVLQALWQTGAAWLVVYAVVLSLVGAYYYIRVVKIMYFDTPIALESTVANPSRDARVVFALNGAAVLLLGIFPGGLMSWCAQAIVHALST